MEWATTVGPPCLLPIRGQMSVLCSLAQILKQVPTTEMQTLSWESAYFAGLWLPPPFSTPPQRPNSKTGPPGCLTRGLDGWAKPQQQEFIAQGTRGEKDKDYS